MTRLIDAEALKEEVHKKSNSPEDVWDTMGVLNLINCSPTVEFGYLTNCSNCERVEKIRASRPRGKWIEENGIPICSECNNGYNTQPRCMGKPMFEFCPICGADMREADNDL